MIDPSLRLRRAIHSTSPTSALLVARILHAHPPLLHNPDASPTGLSNTSLHLAATLGKAPIASLLLTLGHEVPSISLNEDHQTALMLAARAGHTEVVQLLLSQSPPTLLTRRDLRGRDAVMMSCLGGHDTVLQLLLTHAAKISPSDPNAVAELLTHADVDGNTALHFASSNGHLLVLRTLLAAGADAERRNVWSWTAVEYSATVAAEVYFKGLVTEVERRKRVKSEVEREGKGGAVRVVVGEREEV